MERIDERPDAIDSRAGQPWTVNGGLAAPTPPPAERAAVVGRRAAASQRARPSRRGGLCSLMAPRYLSR